MTHLRHLFLWQGFPNLTNFCGVTKVSKHLNSRLELSILFSTKITKTTIFIHSPSFCNFPKSGPHPEAQRERSYDPP
jgi:hypothetical protein